MARTRRVAVALLATLPAMLLGGAKPAPQPSNFVPALSYRYGGTDIRLANADGSQAALLVRLPTSQGINAPVQAHAIAPIGMGRVAFDDSSVAGVHSLRFVTWSQPTPGGPLTVSPPLAPFFTTTGNTLIASLDFSPDGTKVALVEGDTSTGAATTLHFFDGVSGAALGDPVTLADGSYDLKWQADGNGVWLRNNTTFSQYRDGVLTAVFNARSGSFDPLNGASSSLVMHVSVNGYPTQQLWSGGVTDGAPVTSFLVDGMNASVACDNRRLILQQGIPRAKTVTYEFATGAVRSFSQDGNIAHLAYPNGCG
jgi:hypothetical protein